MATLPTTISDAALAMPAPSAVGRGTIATRSIAYAVFKHRRLVIGLFLLVFLASTVAALMRPSTWRADAKVLVKLGETVQIAPAEAPSRSVYLPLNQDVVKTEAEIVKSREVVEEAVAKIGIKPEPGTNLDEMIASMQLAVTVMPLPGSNMLQISYTGKNPERAARMANAITDVYLDHHSKVYQNEGMHSFYTQQLGLLESEMRKAQRKLRDYMRMKKIIDVDQEIQIQTHELVDQEKTLHIHRGKLQATERKLQGVREQLARTPTDIPYAQEYHENPVVVTLKAKLSDLELERNRLLLAYQANDRHVLDKEEEIAKTRDLMKHETDRVMSAQTIRRNDLYSELMRHIYTLEVHLDDLKVREPAMALRVEDQKRRVAGLRDAKFRIANLKQDADDKTYAYQLYRKKQEEARVAEEMKNQAMVNVSVVQRASKPLQPVNGVLLPILIGLFGGLAVAAGMAVGVEYLNRRLRFEEEVERFLELPVLAVIPDLDDTSMIARA